MNDLRRENAPFSDRVWARIDDAARGVLKTMLAARRFVDFDGPKGWDYSAVDLGRASTLAKGPAEGVTAKTRNIRSLIEIEAAFRLDRQEIEAMERGARDANLSAVEEAARHFARAEDRIVFHGYPEAGITGLIEAADSARLTLRGDYERYPEVVANAIVRIKEAGIGGPYGIALGPRCWAGLTQTTTEGGYPVIRHVERLLDGPIVWAPALDGAVVMSKRGGDVVMTVGRDASIGYRDHEVDSVTLYLQESFTTVVIEDKAAVPLAYEAVVRKRRVK